MDSGWNQNLKIRVNLFNYTLSFNSSSIGDKQKFSILHKKDDNKDYENLLIKLSDTKESMDNFFDNVVVNDENQDIKNNRLELLKMFCNTFDNFIDFSKLEGL